MKLSHTLLLTALVAPSAAFGLDRDSLWGCGDPLPMYTGFADARDHLKFDTSRWEGPPIRRFTEAVGCNPAEPSSLGTCSADGRRKVEEYIYDRAGRLQHWNIGSARATYSYSTESRYPIQSLWQTSQPTLKPKSQTIYTRDGKGRIIRKDFVVLQPPMDSESNTDTFEYDELGNQVTIKTTSASGEVSMRTYRDGLLTERRQFEVVTGSDRNLTNPPNEFQMVITRCESQKTSFGRSITATKILGGKESLREVILLDKQDRQIGLIYPGQTFVRRPAVRTDRHGNPTESVLCQIDSRTKHEFECETTYYSYDYF